MKQHNRISGHTLICDLQLIRYHLRPKIKNLKFRKKTHQSQKKVISSRKSLISSHQNNFVTD